MASAARLTLLSVTALLAAAAAGPASATVVRADFQPHAITGATISQGADGTEHTLMCPPDENVLGGGYTVSAPNGQALGSTPGDVLTSRPTADATGWIVSVSKSLADSGKPADLTVQIVCTEGEASPGA